MADNISQKMLYQITGIASHGMNGSIVQIIVNINGISNNIVWVQWYLALNLILCVLFISWNQAKSTHKTAINTPILNTDNSWLT